MTKRFNIHDWQAKQRLSEQDDYQKRQDALTPGKNPGAFFGDDSLMNRKRADWKAPPMGMSPGEKSQESMSNADIKAIQILVGEYSLNKVLNTIAVVADKAGKHDEADMVKKLANQIKDFDDEEENNNNNLAWDDARDYDSDKDFLPKQEIEVTGMEPDSGNMEKEINVVGPTNQNEPLMDVTVEYNGQEYILDFEHGGVDDSTNDEGTNEWWKAEAEDNTIFTVDVYIPNIESTPEVDWDTLEVDISNIQEQNSLGAAGSGASFQSGNSEAYMSKGAWKKQKTNTI
jgi:hypothetical protein